METFVPLDDRVLIEPITAENSVGKIIIPDTVKAKEFRGKVIAAGPGKDSPLSVKEGDTVIYGEFTGTEFSLNGNQYLVMRESDIYGIIK